MPEVALNADTKAPGRQCWRTASGVHNKCWPQGALPQVCFPQGASAAAFLPVRVLQGAGPNAQRIPRWPAATAHSPRVLTPTERFNSAPRPTAPPPPQGRKRRETFVRPRRAALGVRSAHAGPTQGTYGRPSRRSQPSVSPSGWCSVARVGSKQSRMEARGVFAAEAPLSRARRTGAWDSRRFVELPVPEAPPLHSFSTRLLGR